MQYWDSFLHKWCVLKRSGIPPAFSQFKENCWQFPVYENKCDCCKLDSDCSAPIVIGQFTLFCQKGVTVLEHGACPGKMWGPARTWRPYFTLTSASGRQQRTRCCPGPGHWLQCRHRPGPAAALTPDYFPRVAASLRSSAMRVVEMAAEQSTDYCISGVWAAVLQFLHTCR